MGIFDHIDELRVRLMRMLWVFMVGLVGGYLLSDPVMEWLRQPLFAALPADKQALYFTDLFENFMTHLKIGGYIAVFAFSPYFFYEVWGFISPGLRPREKKMVVPFICAATFFFVGGAAFAYYVLFPVGFKYFISYGLPTDVPMLTIDSYYSTTLKLMLLFGLGFELPVFIVLLGVIGIVDAAMLRAHRKFAIIGITIASAMFAPPDAVSMLVMMGPLIAMYEGSIWVVQWIGRPRRVVASVAATEEPADPLRGKSDY